MNLKLFGIRKPATPSTAAPYVWWVTTSEYDSWRMFFTYPISGGEMKAHRLPLEEAIRAYKAIGYECVRLNASVEAEP